ncbi:MAG: M56 family metallopeptidase [Eubacterium sp.]|nr:M56 family metallopeptidase [Eubacterium sp.]
MSLVRVNLLYMSVYGGILILTVLCLRMLLKNRLPKAAFSILWCVALLRLLMPFSVDAPFGVLSVIQNRVEALQERLAAGQGYGTANGKDYRPVFLADLFPEGLHFGKASGYDGVIDGNAGYGSAVGMEKIPTESPAKGGLAENGLYQGFRGLPLLRRIIITGGIICAAVFSLLYLNCLRRFRTALPVEDPFVEQWLDGCRLRRKVKVMQSDRISSPLTYGLVRPVILLPKHLEREGGRKLEYILQHELVHIRRLDGAWKIAMEAALCLHWFNPLVWVMYVFMNRDLELSCDEEVLRVLGTEARKDYALTLIGMEERRQLPVPLYSGFGKNAVEERIGEIMKYKKKTKAAVGAAAALILAVVCVFATTARAKEDPSEADQDPSQESAVMLMDPPVGSSGDMGGAGSGGGSGTMAGTDSNGDVRLADGTKRSEAGIAELPEDGEGGYRLTYRKEGIPESEPAQLVSGQGFYLLIPQEGWISFGPDGWMNEENNEVEIWAACFTAEGSDYQGLDREQIIEALTREGYQEDNGRYWICDEAQDRMMAVELRQANDQDIWGVFYTYPKEAEDGWGVELRAMAQTFAIAAPELSEPEDRAADREQQMEAELARRLKEVEEADRVTQLVRDFMKAAGEKDRDSILPYIAEGYEVDLDCLDRIMGWEQGDMHVSVYVKGDLGNAIVSMGVTMDESEEDPNDHLTLGLIKGGDGWRICFMVFEK